MTGEYDHEGWANLIQLAWMRPPINAHRVLALGIDGSNAVPIKVESDGTVVTSGGGGAGGNVTANAGLGTFQVAGIVTANAGLGTWAVAGIVTANAGLGTWAVTGTVTTTVASMPAITGIVTANAGLGTWSVAGIVTANAGLGTWGVAGTVTSTIASMPAITGIVTANAGLGIFTTQLPVAAALAENMANPTAPAVGAFMMVWDGANWDRAPGTSVGGVQVNSELPPAAALSDTTANPTSPMVGSAGMLWTGSVWVRAPGTIAGGALIAGTVTANAGLGTYQVAGSVTVNAGLGNFNVLGTVTTTIAAMPAIAGIVTANIASSPQIESAYNTGLLGSGAINGSAGAWAKLAEVPTNPYMLLRLFNTTDVNIDYSIGATVTHGTLLFGVCEDIPLKPAYLKASGAIFVRANGATAPTRGSVVANGNTV